MAFSWKQLRIPAVPASTWGTFQKKSALVKVELEPFRYGSSNKCIFEKVAERLALQISGECIIV